MDFLKGLAIIFLVVGLNVAWVALLVWVGAQVVKAVLS